MCRTTVTMFGTLYLLLTATCVAALFTEGHALCANVSTLRGRPSPFTFELEIEPRVIQDWDGEDVQLILDHHGCGDAEAVVCVDGPNKPDVKFREYEYKDINHLKNIINNINNILIVKVDGKIPGHKMPLHVSGTEFCPYI